MSLDDAEPAAAAPAEGIAVVVLTNNRVHLLQQCVENVLARTSDATCEIVIWNNGSTDGTREYLESLDDPRINVVQSEKNIGQNGYARGFALTRLRISSNSTTTSLTLRELGCEPARRVSTTARGRLSGGRPRGRSARLAARSTAIGSVRTSTSRWR